MSVTEISSVKKKDVVDWDDLGHEMWDYLTGKGAAINYQFVNNTAKVPRDTGESAPRATWKLDGTLRITNGGEREQPGVMVQPWVEADITFSVDGAEGTVTADGQVVTVRVSEPARLVSALPRGADSESQVADLLASCGWRCRDRPASWRGQEVAWTLLSEAGQPS